jgi:uncharacterized membrane protein YGL010W
MSVERIAEIDDFWVREFAFYLNEHRDRLNRLTHLFGIPILLVTGLVGLFSANWSLLVGGQVVGWALQLLGHRIEGNRPALLERKISFVMGPMMVLVELAEHLGLRFAFADRARVAVGID